MTRRTQLGLLAVVAGGLLVGASALAFGGPGGRHGMHRFAAAVLDDALDEANVTDEQRTAIYAARDRVFAVLDAQRSGRGAHMEEALQLFEGDRIDPAQVDAVRRRAEEERRKIGDAITQALVDVHAVLTPEQRKAVADYVRSYRGRHWH